MLSHTIKIITAYFGSTIKYILFSKWTIFARLLKPVMETVAVSSASATPVRAVTTEKNELINNA